MSWKDSVQNQKEGFLLSYSQVFFAESRLFGLLLLAVSFLDVYTGLAGAISVIAANLTGCLAGYSDYKVKKGLYGFNALLVGLGIGINYSPSVVLFVIVVLAAIITLFVTVTVEGVLSRYGLPYLGLPFLLVIWTFNLSFYQFHNLWLSERNIYTVNELYAWGGLWLVKLNDKIISLFEGSTLETYFLSLGAIFFQYHLIAGMIIALLLLLYSRVMFLFSLLGFYSAYAFYTLIGSDASTLNYTYYGFNFILSSIALSYFYLPSWRSVLVTLLMIPAIVLFTIASDKVFGVFRLSAYAFPFVLAILGLLYAMQLRISGQLLLYRIPIQQSKPEFNKYLYSVNLKRFEFLNYLPVALPFWGKWLVNQGHNGSYTHQDEWGYAWDFVIDNDDNKEYEGKGREPQDYFCYGKPIVAPAAGIVVAVADNVPDNNIGEVNQRQNWGNTVVIKHSEYLYSQLSHLQPGSIKVKQGDFVEKGRIIANCGNSGRSPYPHLHFQLQATPYIGSKTLLYPLSNYVKYTNALPEFVETGIPANGDRIENIKENSLLKNAFDFVPGQKIKLEFDTNSVEIEAGIDIYNHPYLYDNDSKSYLYFVNNGAFFIAQNYIGSMQSPLYLFYLVFRKVLLAYYDNMSMEDNVPVHHSLLPASIRWLQDVVSPFGMFSDALYTLTYEETDSEMAPGYVKMKANFLTLLFRKTFFEFSAWITARKDGTIVVELDKKVKGITTLIVKRN